MKQEKLVLQKNVTVDRYQVQGQIDRETKRNPFIAVLLLANEVESMTAGLTADVLRKKLLPALPLRASENVLLRLVSAGYLELPPKQEGIESGWAIRLLGVQNGYRLSPMGKIAASKKIFWDQELGQFEIVLCKNPLVAQQIVSVVVTRGERLTDAEINLPKEIAIWHKVELNFPDRNQMIHLLEEICFHLGTSSWKMVIEASEKKAICRLKHGDKEIYSVILPEPMDASRITRQLLIQKFETDYDLDRNVVLTHFDPRQLAFLRSVQIDQPELEGEVFEKLTLHNIHHIPRDQQQARLWHLALLVKDATRLFATEADFRIFEREVAERFQPYFKLPPIGLDDLTAFMDDSKTPFYQRIKFETFQFLHY